MKVNSHLEILLVIIVMFQVEQKQYQQEYHVLKVSLQEFI